MKGKVSILIPVFNASQYLEESIRSALSQSYESLEILISDNCSTDDSFRIAESFTDSRITLFRQTRNLGMHGNWNFLLSHASGDYGMILGADDSILPSHIEVRVQHAANHPNNAFIYGPYELINSNGEKIRTSPSLTINQLSAKDGILSMIDANPLNILSVFFNLRLIRTNRLSFQDNPLCDWRLWLDLLSFGEHYLTIPENTVRYRVHNKSVTSQSKKSQWMLSSSEVVTGFCSENSSRLLAIGVKPDILSRHATRNLWLAIPRAIKDRRIDIAWKSAILYFQHHSTLEFAKSCSRFLKSRWHIS